MTKIANDDLLNPVWHRMLYSCTRMATVGVKGLTFTCLANKKFSAAKQSMHDMMLLVILKIMWSTAIV